MYKIQEANIFDPQQLRELKKIVARGEGLTLEFKHKATHPHKIAREFVAFANAKGGTLLLGVNDDAEIVGVKHPEGESHAIHEALKICKPIIQFQENFIPLSDSRIVIRYEVKESEVKPHFIKEETGVHAYVRIHDKCMKASRQMCEVLKRSRKKSGVKFTYGEDEKLLMQYLELHKYITLGECTVLLKINKWKASRKLVLLVLADVLQLIPTEKGDVYCRQL